MTYFELIRNTHGNNPVTEAMLNRIANNLSDLISELALTLTTEDFVTVRNGLIGERHELGVRAIKDIVGFTLNDLDIMQLPNDGKASLLDKIGSTVSTVLKLNLKLFEDTPAEPAPETAMPEDAEPLPPTEEPDAKVKEEVKPEPKAKKKGQK